ncbi:MAG: hypothetical protein E7635_04030 [Ruminococcaceae bacterium]|nr:hypothetical protein [Oscillospiraceae bacterium]
MSRSEKIKRVSAFIITVLLVASIAALVYAMNKQTALCRDDYSYSYTFAVKENKFRITNFGQIIDSQINHYKVMNGRAVTHTLAQIFLMFDKSVFDLINTAAFTILICFIVYHAKPTGKTNYSLMFLSAFLSLWFFTPSFGKSYLWLTGACNYLWGILIILLYLLPLRRALNSPYGMKTTTIIVLSPLYFVSGVIAGWTNENTSAALIVISLLMIIAITIKRKRFSAWTLTGFAGNICGFLLMILAPGQSVRLEANGGFGSFDVWVKRFLLISTDMFKYHGILLILLCIFAVIAIIRKKKPKDFLITGIFFVGWLASVYSMILSPYFPLRTWSGPTILLTITLLSAMGLTLPEDFGRKTSVIICIMSACLGYIFAEDYKQAYNDISITKAAVDARVEAINNAKRDGLSEIELDSIYGHSRFDPYVSLGDLNNDSSTWPNTAIAMYFGLDEVRKK